MPITEETHPYRVKLADKIVAFPASMSEAQVQEACRGLSEPRSAKSPKAAPAPKSQAKVKKAASILGADNTGNEVASRLAQILDGVDPKTASEEEKDKIFQSIIEYRRVSRSLPEEQRAVLDRKIATFSNSQVRRPAKKR